ncbi:hypothetical protein CJF32_00010807 [Rutstroemia sp. NJR-2017a WRK4]|nr:hypothetical protein CJF32_00010807 [Rutstroemia sp. NJR-2017a WRK4]
MIKKKLSRRSLGLIVLRGFVANLEPAGKRAGFGRGALDLLLLPRVPIANGTRRLPQNKKHDEHDYEFDCSFIKEDDITEEWMLLLHRLLWDAYRDNEEIILLCLSSLTDIAKFCTRYPILLRASLEKGKVVLQGGYSVVDGNLKVKKGANNEFDPTAATKFHEFLKDNKISSMAFENAAINLKHPLPRKMFTDLANTGEIGQYLNNVAERQESKFFFAASLMGDKAMDRLKIIVTPRSEWPETIHQVVGNGSENSLNGTGDGVSTTLEALIRGSLLAVSQGLSSDPV